jgi:signal transduction histidine kinase
LGSTFADQATLAIANNRLRRQAEQIAVASERSRLARDLHDAVTQTIFSASLIAETIPVIWENDQDEGKNLLRDMRQLTRGALAEMRTLLLELRPAALEEANLADLLRQLSESVGGRTGIHVITKTDEIDDLPVNVKVTLYRIAQEALNNVMKHARASHIEVRLSSSEEKKVSLVVQDNGRGFDLADVPADRFGLDNMRERAEAIGAILTIHSQPEQGTQIMVEWQEEDQE